MIGRTRVKRYLAVADAPRWRPDHQAHGSSRAGCPACASSRRRRPAAHERVMRHRARHAPVARVTASWLRAEVRGSTARCAEPPRYGKGAAMLTITALETHDLRFPTSRELGGSA